MYQIETFPDMGLPELVKFQRFPRTETVPRAGIGQEEAIVVLVELN